MYQNTIIVVVAACCACIAGAAPLSQSPVVPPESQVFIVAQSYGHRDDKEASRYRPPPPAPYPSGSQHHSQHSSDRHPSPSREEPAVWVPGRWERLRGADVWVPGHWERRNNYR